MSRAASLIALIAAALFLTASLVSCDPRPEPTYTEAGARA